VTDLSQKVSEHATPQQTAHKEELGVGVDLPIVEEIMSEKDCTHAVHATACTCQWDGPPKAKLQLQPSSVHGLALLEVSPSAPPNPSSNKKPISVSRSRFRFSGHGQSLQFQSAFPKICITKKLWRRFGPFQHSLQLLPLSGG